MWKNWPFICVHAEGRCKVLPGQEASRDHHSDWTQVCFGFMSSLGGWRFQCHLPTSPEEWFGGSWGTLTEWEKISTCSDNALKSVDIQECLLSLVVGGFHSSWHLFGISDDREQWDWSQTAHHWDWLVFQLLWASQYLSNLFEPVVQLRVSCSLHLSIWLDFVFFFFMLKGCIIISFPSPGRICRSKGVFLHTDAAQAVGKIPINVSDWKIDLMSISGHKIYGPKG